MTFAEGRVVNFSAGPGVLPVSVLEQAQADLVALPGVGASALEVSHRGTWFTGVIEEAEANLRTLLAIPDTHRVLFLQGGASMQFSMVAQNLLRGSGQQADYVLTGSWGEKALQEAAREGATRVAWSGKEEGFTRTPDTEASYDVITGKFTVPEAKLLAKRLNAGALPVPIVLESQQSVGASLGQDSLDKSLFAGLLGFLAIAIFMLVYSEFIYPVSK